MLLLLLLQQAVELGNIDEVTNVVVVVVAASNRAG